MRLSQAVPGDSGTVCRLQTSGMLAQRLLDFGIGPGTTFSVVRMAPLGDPMELQVGSMFLCIRKEEAHHVEVCLS